jgi:hypothetical protein
MQSLLDLGATRAEVYLYAVQFCEEEFGASASGRDLECINCVSAVLDAAVEAR